MTLPLLILLVASNVNASVISYNKNNLVADVTCERSTTPDELLIQLRLLAVNQLFLEIWE
jgi:hypothetical protein